MRTLFIIIVIGALGYLGWQFRDELAGKFKNLSEPSEQSAEQPTADEPSAPAAAIPATPAPAVATPAPKTMAPAGSFYVKERVSLESDTGIKVLNAGELVTLKYRNKDGTARVTAGKSDVVIKEALLTRDPEEIKKK